MTVLVLSFPLTVFGLSLWAGPRDADTAVAVAVGLADAGRAMVEVPASVEVASPRRPVKADSQKPDGGRIEWVPTCDQYGCRLVPRIVSAESPRAATQLGPDAAADSSTTAPAASISCNDGRCAQWKRRIFGRRR
jgi:hypothetical protein